MTNIKWKAVKQTGEMSYGQPHWVLFATPEEVERSQKEKPHPSFSFGEIKLSNITRLDVEAWYRRKKPLTKVFRKKFLVVDMDGQDFTRTNIEYKTNPIVEVRYLIETNIHCFKNVEEIANYFGERMDKDFFERYEGRVIEKTIETNNEE